MAWLTRLVQWLDAFLTSLEEAYMHRNDPIEPVKPPQTPQDAPGTTQTTNSTNTPQMTLLDQFCTAIRDYEGSPGDLNYQNNNPGNCRCSSVGYLPKYGNVLCVETASGKFAKFPTYELGWEYLEALVKEKVAKNPTWTIRDFMHNYSPSSDNNDPDTYAAYIAKRLVITVDFPMSKIVA